MRLRAKLFYNLLFFAILASCVGVLLWQHLKFLQQAEQRQLKGLYESFTAEISSKANSAVAVAAALAAQPQLNALFEQDKRAELISYLTPTWQRLRDDFNVEQLQLHTAQSESYLRMHAPEVYGDTLSSFRKTVVQAIESASAVSGLELGRYGIGIRGVVPLLSAAAQPIGSIEVGFAVDDTWLQQFKAKHDAEISLFTYQNKLELLSSTQSQDLAWPDLSSARFAPQLWTSQSGASEVAHYSFTLNDYSGDVIGVVDVAMNRDFYRYAKRKAIVLAIVSVLISLITTYVLNLSILRLRRKMAQAKQQKVQLEQSQQQNISMLNYIVEKEKMASLGQLVSGVAHEINTPLGVAITANSCNLSQSKVIKQQFAENELSRKILSEYLLSSHDTHLLIEYNLARMALLVEKFKSLAVRKGSDEKQIFSLYKLFNSVADSLKSECEMNKLTVRIEVSQQFDIQGQPLEFINIAHHIILNTLHHGLNPDQTELVITVDIEQDRLLISFSDNGPGVAPANLEHIFAPFFTTARNKACTGLGLSIVYNVVTQKFKGEIQAQSPCMQNGGFKLTLSFAVAKAKAGQVYELITSDPG